MQKESYSYHLNMFLVLYVCNICHWMLHTYSYPLDMFSSLYVCSIFHWILHTYPSSSSFSELPNANNHSNCTNMSATSGERTDPFFRGKYLYFCVLFSWTAVGLFFETRSFLAMLLSFYDNSLV